MLNANCTSVSLSFDCQLFNYYNLKNGGLEVEHDLWMSPDPRAWEIQVRPEAV